MKSNKKGIWKYLHCDLYDVDIYMYIGDYKNYKINNLFYSKTKSKNISNYILKELDGYLNDGLLAENCCVDIQKTGKQYIVIFLEKYSVRDIDNISIFVHECCHAALYIASVRDMVFSKDNANEPLVYLTEWIFKEFSKLLKGKNK